MLSSGLLFPVTFSLKFERMKREKWFLSNVIVVEKCKTLGHKTNMFIRKKKTFVYYKFNTFVKIRIMSKKKRKYFQTDAAWHYNLKPTWNTRQTVEEEEAGEGNEKRDKIPGEDQEDNQSIISYNGAVIDNFDSVSVRSRRLSNGYAKRITPTSEIVLDCGLPKISQIGLSEKETTELNVISINRLSRFVKIITVV